VYCRADRADDPWTVVSAWLHALPDDSVLSGPTAAWLHGLELNPSNPVEVTVPLRTWPRSRPGLRVRHCAITPDEVVCIDGRRATSIDRTLRDLSSRLPEVELMIALDGALRRGVLDASRHTSPRRLHRLALCAAPAESPMETRLRWLLVQAGLPRPEVQADLHDSNGTFLARADLYYPDARLVIEYDGGNHRDRLVEDDSRQNTLVDAGYKLLRYTASDVYQRPEFIVTQVRRALVSGTEPRAVASSG
jgi:hypothetical protein